jgi:hypothetical protein
MGYIQNRSLGRLRGMGDATDFLATLTDASDSSVGASPLVLIGVGLLVTAIALSYTGKVTKRYTRRRRMKKRRALVSQLTAL